MAGTNDPYDLERFVEAQKPVVNHVRAELAAGRKTSHWMWFVFPQLLGLGSSTMAQAYAVTGLAEARAYLDHPLLGARLREFTALAVAVPGRSAKEVFGPPDDLKFRSSMTLFAQAAPGEQLFGQALDRYFAGQPDPETLRLLA